ncbi:DUF4232 domain-containing protein [Streptomyces sp. UNOC14_S4]|uniref:DUF4232 domain-containing protein n=1 Tax=Streptomyces sp. UNOC14_S4 TaxID=2872340 RepID=UPI001E55B705|nr:DUF4232 domain-containing protein [Streptomyces sp. UNOC14_S4]MCC3771650.1 DUF4232 domain-containing protein [Streptomyces sp. UNOC14_S4]
MRTASLTTSAVLAAAVLAVSAGQSQAAAPAAKATSDKRVTAACTAADTKVTVQNVTRPINHQLLTVTNAGNKACNLYGHPYLRFGEAQSATRAVEDSKPQAVVTLAPGRSGYAGINLSAADGSGQYGHTATSLAVFFDNGTGEGSAGRPVHLTLPKGTWTDETAYVTYWQQTAADALVW